MAPATKGRRQPEPWKTGRGKARLVVETLGHPTLDTAALGGCGVPDQAQVQETLTVKRPVGRKTKKKPPPGPDAATSLEDEYFKITESKRGCPIRGKGSLGVVVEDTPGVASGSTGKNMESRREDGKITVDNDEDTTVPVAADKERIKLPSAGASTGGRKDVEEERAGRPVNRASSREVLYTISSVEDDTYTEKRRERSRSPRRRYRSPSWGRENVFSERSPMYVSEMRYRAHRRGRSRSISAEIDDIIKRHHSGSSSHKRSGKDFREMSSEDMRHRGYGRLISGRRNASDDRGMESPRSRGQRQSASPRTPPRRPRRDVHGFVDSSTSKRYRVKEEGEVEEVDHGEGFEMAPATKKFLPTLSLNKETMMRRNRRQREISREVDDDRRRQEGERRHYINVNEDGKPYGLGISVWNDTIGKLVRGLDPSFIDIRQQPFHLMEVLMERLNNDFEYSGKVNRAWLRTRIGNSLSSYRHELMRLIQAKSERPPWVKEAIWTRLTELEGSEKYRMKSQQMRYANACRKTKGRTGPIGEAGVAERLRMQLGRYPDPEEVQEEMNRDKGYSGRVRKPTLPQVKISEQEKVVEEEGLQYKESSLGSGESRDHISPLSTNAPAVLETGVYMSVESCTVADKDSAHYDGKEEGHHPLARIILKQIDDLRSAEHVDVAEVEMVVKSLMEQVRALDTRKVNSSETGPLHSALKNVVKDTTISTPAVIIDMPAVAAVEEPRIVEPLESQSKSTRVAEPGKSKSGRVYKTKKKY